MAKAHPMRRGLFIFPLVLLAGCVPVVNQRGYLPNPTGEAAIKAGDDTETTVQAKLQEYELAQAMGQNNALAIPKG